MLDLWIRRLADYGVRIALVSDRRRRRFRLYQHLDYERDGLSGDKLLRDWSEVSEAASFLEGMFTALAMRLPDTPG